MARPRLIRLLALPLTLATAGGVFLSVPTSAQAVDIKTQIAQAKARLTALDDQSEAAAEHYNGARIALAGTQQAAATAQQQAKAAQQRLSVVSHQVDTLAAQAYIQGGSADMTLMSQAQDPQGFLDRAGYLDSLARQQTGLLITLKAAQQDAQSATSAASQALAAQQRVVAELQSDKQRVADAAAQAQQVLSYLEAKQAELIRQARIAAARAAAARHAAALEQARRELAAAQRAAAALAGQRAAAAEAARQFAAQQAAAAAAPAPAPAPPASSKQGSAGGSAGAGGSGGSQGSPSTDAAGVAVQWAHQELGKPYVWAAAGPDTFDCSGLTMYVYAKAGVSLPHFAASQYDVGRHVSRGELRPGDLLFYGSPIHHVGIYIGNGQMIEAPHTGVDVRIAGIDRSDYVGAARIVG